MAVPVKYFHSGQAGAPVLSSSAGALLAVLDACLVNGFGLQVLDSLSVVDGVLIGNKASHGFTVDQVIKVSGANQSQLNGEWVVTAASTGSFHAAATGIANVTGTGTITAKAAPAGWEKAFSSTNIAAYRSLDPESCACLLRINDTGGSARARGYVEMTDIDTGSDPFPTDAQVSGGGYIPKGSASTPWIIVADSKVFYLMTSPRTDFGTLTYLITSFCDFASERAGDAYACALQTYGVGGDDPAHAWTQIGLTNFTDAQSKLYAARSFNQMGDSVQLLTSFIGQHPSGHPSGLVYPSGASNGIILSHIVAKEVVSNTMRCLSLPGVYATPQAQPLNSGSVIRHVGIGDKTMLVVSVGLGSYTAGRLIFDLTGPW